MRRVITLDCEHLHTPMVCSFCGAPAPTRQHKASITVCMCEACLKQAVAAIKVVAEMEFVRSER